MINISISKDFSDAPGGRYRCEGDFSGEEFREELLKPKYEEAIAKSEKLCVNFDDCYGFAASFLEEAFGGIVRDTGNTKIKDILIIISNDRKDMKKKVEGYIDAAYKELRDLQ